MKLYAPLFAVLLAVPAFAQTATTEGDASTTAGGSMSATEQSELSTRVGSTFFSDDTMTTLRPSADIQTQWSTLSTADQDALRARCTALMGMEPSKGNSADAGTSTDASTGTDSGTGSDAGASSSTDASGTTTAEDMGFFMDDVRMRPVCEAISGL